MLFTITKHDEHWKILNVKCTFIQCLLFPPQNLYIGIHLWSSFFFFFFTLTTLLGFLGADFLPSTRLTWESTCDLSFGLRRTWVVPWLSLLWIWIGTCLPSFMTWMLVTCKILDSSLCKFWPQDNEASNKNYLLTNKKNTDCNYKSTKEWCVVLVMHKKILNAYFCINFGAWVKML